MLIPSYIEKQLYKPGALSDVYKFVHKTMNQNRYSIAECQACIEPFPREQSLVNKDIRRWLKWVNYNIVIQLGEVDFTTLGVKLRIATGMLNRIESLTDLEKIQIHSNLTRNVNEEFYRIFDENLPF